jgi:MOSC domain-containing protein YiiM
MSKILGLATRKKLGAPMIELTEADVTFESGVADDCKGKPGPRQVTVLSLDDWHLAEKTLGKPLDWRSIRRTNLLIDQINFGPWLEGRVLRIGKVRLAIRQVIEPCYRKDRLIPGLKDALTPDWRAGVCCEVLAPGHISLHDAVELEP